MGKSTATSDLKALLVASKGKSLIDSQDDYSSGLIDIIAALIESSSSSTTVATIVTNATPLAAGPVTGAQPGAIGTISVPA